MTDHHDDPVAKRFDRLLALVGYGLLFMSVFTFWVPALVAAGLAFAYRRGADPVASTHFRFQLKIFWIGLAIFTLAVIAFLAAGGFAVGAVWGVIAPGFDGLMWSWPDTVKASAATAGLSAVSLTAAGLALLFAGSAWTVLASLWGGWRLVNDRPIGQSGAARALEPR